MSYVIQRGIFFGIDDALSAHDDAISIIQGALSATVLHAELESRSSEAKWELATPNDNSRLVRAYILGRLTTFLTEASNSEPAIMYFSGHGCSFQGKYIFCPQDFNQAIPDASGLTFDLLATLIQRSNPQKRRLILIFDTCRSLIDPAAEVGEAVPPNCTVIYTCEHGKDVIEIDGYSDFVRGLLQLIKEAARSKKEGLTKLGMAELIEEMQTLRPQDGSGNPIRLKVAGQSLADTHLSIASDPSVATQKRIECRLYSRPRPAGACGRFRGEMLNKITHSTGVPMDPGIVEIIEANTKGMEALRVVLPLMRPVKSARILDYIVKEWSYLFTDLCLSIPSLTIAKRFSRLMRTYDFDVWTAENKIVAIKKIGGAAAKAEFAPKGKDFMRYA